MPIIVQFLFVLFAIVFCGIGTLMLFAPRRYPSLYQGFLRESIVRRQHIQKDRILTIRVQRCIVLTVGTFFAVFVWALR